MRRGQEEYRQQLHVLTQEGGAMPRDPSTVLSRLFWGLAATFARIEGRGYDLADDALPNRTVELLPDWEEVAGLPDECTGPGGSVAERQAALVERLTTVGSSAVGYFLQRAADLGYTDVTIIEHKPFRCGLSRCGDRLAAAERQFVWTVVVGGLTLRYFRAGVGRTGERLGSFGQTSLQCVFERIKPAHTRMIFASPQ